MNDHQQFMLAAAEILVQEVKTARFLNPFRAYRVYKIIESYEAAKLSHMQAEAAE